MAGIFAGFICSCTEFNMDTKESLPVVEAYLYANSQEIELKVSEMIPFSESGSEQVVVEDAQIVLSNETNTYSLVHDETRPGYYISPTPIEMISGSIFSLQMEHGTGVVIGSTEIPEMPVGVKLSKHEVKISPINTLSEFEQLRDLDFAVQWDNPDNSFYFVTIDNISESPQSIFDFGSEVNVGFSLITEPTVENMRSFNLYDINQFGTYRVRVYKVNSEYVDLYNSKQQDSRNLNEPLTNLENANGIFTAFSYDEVTFKIIKD